MLPFHEGLFRVFVLAGPALLALPASNASADASLAAVRLSEGWATFGQALPMGAARTGLQVGAGWALAAETTALTTTPTARQMK